MKNNNIIIIAVIILGCTGTQNSVKSNDDKGGMDEITGHTSQNSIDWQGTYRGILPCENCEGIEATVSLTKDSGFRAKYRDIGKSDSTIEIAGTFDWNKSGNSISLTPSVNGETVQYFVGENTLTKMDVNSNKVGGNEAARYILSKSNFDILEKYWKLVELNGKQVTTDSTARREAHIIFKEADNKVNGNGGCNNISGAYKVEGLNRISFSKMISTKMACPRMDVEAEFLSILENIDNFSLNGDTLTLNKARMAPLARFHAVYMK